MDNGGCCLGVTNLPPSCADYPEIMEASRPFTFQGTKFYFLRKINFESVYQTNAMHFFFTLLRYHASICLGPICSPSSVKVKQVPFATLYTQPPDDGLQMGPKHVEAW
jgi:hypothetical protein